MKFVIYCLALIMLVGCGDNVIISPDATLPDGSVYAGEIVDNKFHGRGKLVYPSGAYYEGEFKDGSFNGQGIYINSSGEEYQGNFIDGDLEGHGSFTDLRGNVYEGEFVGWAYDGQGKLSLGDGSVYEGEFKQGIYHGEGKFTQDDAVYEGRFVDGNLQGNGRIVDFEGAVYTGEIEDWVATGEGAKVTAEGLTIRGTFNGGFAEGVGEITTQDGWIYKGEINYDKPDGKGEMTYPDGRIYKGEFSYGLRNGVGTLVTPAKEAEAETSVAGQWSGDQLVHDFAGKDRQHSQAEVALENHQQLLDQAVANLVEQSPDKSEVYFLGVAGDGSQSVFKREIEFIRPLIERRYGSQGRSIALINHHDTAEQIPMATRRSIKTAISAIAEKIDRDDDVLLMYFTSHGSPDHEFYLNHDSIKLPSLSAPEFSEILNGAKIKWKVIIISACYAGGFIRELSDEHTLVITAADAESQSFGCPEDSDMTYFGRALFTRALTENPDLSLPEAFKIAKRLVTQWEDEQEKPSSNPLMDAPNAIVEKLASLRR